MEEEKKIVATVATVVEPETSPAAETTKVPVTAPAPAAGFEPTTPAKKKTKVRTKVAAIRDNGASNPETEKKNSKTVALSAIFLLAIMIIYVIYLVASGEMDSFVSSMKGVDLGWLIAGIVCFMCYYVFGVLVLAVSIADDPSNPAGISDLVSVQSAFVFFMRLSPYGLGASPAQIYRLTRAGMSAGSATALSFVRKEIYEICEGLVPAVLLLFTATYYSETFGDQSTLAWVLFGFKILQVGVMLVLCLFPKPVMLLCNWALGFVHDHGWIKDEWFESWSEKVNTEITLFAEGFREACSDVPKLLLSVLFTVLQLSCMYALPWFLLKSFGESGSFLICYESAALLELLVNCSPIPSGAGGVEVAFPYLYGDMFGSHVSAGFVLWRAIEYFLPVLIAAPCMGLRTKSGESVNARWTRTRKRLRHAGESISGFFKGNRPRKKERGVTVKPSGKGSVSSSTTTRSRSSGTGSDSSGSNVEARIAMGKASAAKKNAAAKSSSVASEVSTSKKSVSASGTASGTTHAATVHPKES